MLSLRLAGKNRYQDTCRAFQYKVMNLWGALSRIYTKFHEHHIDALITCFTCAINGVSTKRNYYEVYVVFYNVAWTHHDHSNKPEEVLVRTSLTYSTVATTLWHPNNNSIRTASNLSHLRYAYSTWKRSLNACFDREVSEKQWTSPYCI